MRVNRFLVYIAFGALLLGLGIFWVRTLTRPNKLGSGKSRQEDTTQQAQEGPADRSTAPASTEMSYLRNIQHLGEGPEGELPDSLATLETQVLSATEGTDLIAKLNAIAHSPSETEIRRVLAALLLGRTSPAFARKALWDLLTTDASKLSLSIAYSLALERSSQDLSRQDRVDFWTALLSSFDIGDMILPGFRQRQINRLRGLPPDAPAPDTGADAIPLPFDAYRPKKTEDPEIERRILEIIRAVPSERTLVLWPLLKTGPNLVLLAKEILFDNSRTKQVRIEAASVLKSSEPQQLLLACKLEPDTALRAEFLAMASNLQPASSVMELLRQALQAEPSSERVILVMADGLCQSGNREGVEYLGRLAVETNDSQLRTRLLRALALTSRSDQTDMFKEAAIKRVLSHTSASVRREALDSLWLLRGRSAIETVRQLAQFDPSPEVREAAKGLLNNSEGPK